LIILGFSKEIKNPRGGDIIGRKEFVL